MILDNSKPKPEWSMNRAKINGNSHAQVKSEKTEGVTDNDNASTKSDLTKSSFSIQGNQERTVGWAGAHIDISFFQQMTSGAGKIQKSNCFNPKIPGLQSRYTLAGGRDC
eukprot:scaffold129047_cov29-Attheya_sp.AAC.1